MGIFSRFRRRKEPYRAVGEEEQISRYIYLLNTLPPRVIENAHASAFQDVPADRRREMFEQLRPFMSDDERHAKPGDPHVLAKLVRRAEERRAERAEANGGAAAEGAASTKTMTAAAERNENVDPRDVMMHSGVMALVAYQFLATSAVNSYFTVGAGSLVIGDQPGWVGETFDPGSTGIDAAGFGGGYDGGGGGYDGGGFGGGFDAGGFGGGFDGGGGFG
ncbi:MAG: hypothetical protein ABWZ16_04555 [Microbacterium sp.]